MSANVLLFSPKIQPVKRGKILRVKLSARNEKQNRQSTENLSFAWLVWLPITAGGMKSKRKARDELSATTEV